MTTTAISTERLRELIEQELPHLVSVRHDLHAHPELGYEEHRTSKVVQRELSDAGVKFAADLGGGTGVLGHLPGESAKAVGLRADMDALPIVEQTGLDYASKHEGVMHACGHDGHTTILIGAARVLSRLASEGDLPRPVTFVFQPAEEGGAGALKMIDDGCLTGSVLGPPIENMFGLHGWPLQPLGTVGTKPGPLLAAADMFTIHIKGVGAHAAFPHGGRDPIVAAAAIINALQTIVSRNVDPLDSIVISTTMMHGGTAHNIIPEAVTLEGTVRTLTPETHKIAQERMEEAASLIARGHGCEAQLEYRMGYPVTLNDPGAVTIVEDTARAAYGEDRVIRLEQPVMGGEDFSFYCHRVPSCFFTLGLLPPGMDEMPQLHQPTFNFNDEAIPMGVETFCRLALRG